MNTKMMVISPEMLKILKEFEAEYVKWNVDLFSPKGLEMLFRRGK